MAGTLTKEEDGHSNERMDQQSVDNGALEQLHSSSPQFSPTAERRLVRKIDFTLVSILTMETFLGC
jgi:hypothetical protein